MVIKTSALAGVFLYICLTPNESAQMKKIHLLLFTLLVTATLTAQKKEKIKGSKTISVTQRDIENFEAIEVEDNIEVFLIKGGAPGLEIEADDNLHDAIQAEVKGSTLRVFTSKNVTRYKNFTVRITYTNDLTKVTARHESVINALAHLEVDNVTIKNFDYSKSYLNVKSANFTLEMDDKAKAELNFKGDSCTVRLSKSATLEALIATQKATVDLYQDAKAEVEGDAANATLRFDNSSVFTGSKFTVKNIELTAEGYSDCEVMAAEAISISASGKAEVSLYGDAKIDMKSFTKSATLYKKEL